jgi:hypothetical protein
MAARSGVCPGGIMSLYPSCVGIGSGPGLRPKQDISNAVFHARAEMQGFLRIAPFAGNRDSAMA